MFSNAILVLPRALLKLQSSLESVADVAGSSLLIFSVERYCTHLIWDPYWIGEAAADVNWGLDISERKGQLDLSCRHGERCDPIHGHDEIPQDLVQADKLLDSRIVINSRASLTEIESA